ncbi:MAG: thioredoxin [Actinomycetes bacterium]
MGAITEVSDSSFQAEVIDSITPVLVDFWAPWCGPCRQVAPVLEQIGAEQGEALKIVKVNVDDNQQTAAQYGVMSIPTLIMFKGGQKVHQVTGALPKAALERELQLTEG